MVASEVDERINCVNLFFPLSLEAAGKANYMLRHCLGVDQYPHEFLVSISNTLSRRWVMRIKKFIDAF